MGGGGRRRRGTQKTVLERKAPPTFGVLIEIQEKDRLAVHHDVSEVVDRFLRDIPARPEIRVRTDGGGVEILEGEERSVRFAVLGWMPALVLVLGLVLFVRRKRMEIEARRTA